MKWIPTDIEQYLQAKEYVDTVIIPLNPISFESDMKQTASMTEFTTLLTVQMERQFKGRILLVPPFSYLKAHSIEENIESLLKWEKTLLETGVKHIFYVSSDSDWKINEASLTGSLIWIPAIPLEHLEEKYKHSLLEDQVKQLMNLFVQKWTNNQ